jgi:thioesterase domain-containing protein
MSARMQGYGSAMEAPPRRLDRSFFALEAQAVSPAGEVEARLTHIWERILGIDGLGVEDDFFQIGGDSLLAVALFGEIGREFGQAPALSVLLDCPTVRSLAGRLQQQNRISSSSPLIAVRAEGARPPLFLAHAIEGDVVFAHKILPYLSADQPLYAIRARGLEGDEVPHRRFEDMAADFLALIRQVQPRGPYFIVGYCAGSLTALEMARQLRASAEDVGFVGLIDPNTHPNAAPWLYWRDPDSRPVLLLRRAIAALEVARARAGLRRMSLRTGPRREAGESDDRYSRRQAIWGGITEALARYRPRPYAGSVTIFGSTRRMSHLVRMLPGWGALATAHEVLGFKGGHDDLFERSLPQLAAALREALERASLSAIKAAPADDAGQAKAPAHRAERAA